MLSHFLRVAALKTLTPTVRASTQATALSTNSLTINKPAGVQSGDLLIAFVLATGTRTWTPPSGFTETLDSNTRQFSYRVADGTEGASFTFTLSASETALGGVCVAVQNAQYDTVGTVSGLANPTVAAAITVASNNSLVFDFVSSGAGSVNWTDPSGWTLLQSNTDAAQPSFKLYSRTFPAGSTGTVSISSSTSDTSRSF
jgi:hypothetical protein